jgi:hypothetical protein
MNEQIVDLVKHSQGKEYGNSFGLHIYDEGPAEGGVERLILNKVIKNC